MIYFCGRLGSTPPICRPTMERVMPRIGKEKNEKKISEYLAHGIKIVIGAAILSIPATVYSVFEKNEQIKKVSVVEKRLSIQEKIINELDRKIEKNDGKHNLKYELLHKDVKYLIKRFDEVHKKR